jgi:hypothetical protein
VSATLTAKEYDPAAGVPEIVPEELVRVRPVGRLPDERVHV